MGDELTIETRGLTRSYGGRRVVDDLNLAVRRGEIYGFLGQNGAGKTTTMRLLLGLIAPTSGEVRVFGKRLHDDRLGLLARTGALVENPGFYPFLSGRRNLLLMARATGRAEGAAKAVDEALDQVELRERGGDLYKGYSRGMKQRLGIAWAVLGRPELVLLDEPLNGLDPPAVLRIRALIKDIVAKGSTVFLSSHLLHEVEMSCDRVAIIDRGRLIAQGSVAELIRPDRETLELEVANAEAALVAVRTLAYVKDARMETSTRERAHGVSAPTVLVVELEFGRSAELNAALVAAGHVASAIVPRRLTLEELYHTRVAQSRHVPGVAS